MIIRNLLRKPKMFRGEIEFHHDLMGDTWSKRIQKEKEIS